MMVCIYAGVDLPITKKRAMLEELISDRFYFLERIKNISYIEKYAAHLNAFNFMLHSSGVLLWTMALFCFSFYFFLAWSMKSNLVATGDSYIVASFSFALFLSNPSRYVSVMCCILCIFIYFC